MAIRKLGSINVLVVEDDTFFQNIISKILDTIGVASVVVTGNGEEALKHLGNADSSIDIVISDIDTPEMTGWEFVRTIRDGLAKLGYQCQDSPTAIIPIMIGDAAETQAKSARLMELGVMVTGFSYPVVPEGEARLRAQVSAALEPSHIEKALDAFAKL